MLTKFFSRLASLIAAAVILLPATSFSQENNYPDVLLKDKPSVKVTDLKSFDSVNSKLRTYLRTLSNGVKVPIKVENAYTFKNNDSLYINFNRNVADYPIRQDGVKKIYEIVKTNLPSSLKNKKVAIFSNGSRLEDLVTPFYNTTGSWAKIQKEGTKQEKVKGNRLKEQEGKPYAITKGL
ncbi:MAG: hypothetical protein IK041_02910, partial [Bacteroidales bacterium]|nr:hypothetical protein [Bacteroidales bacterium]